MEKYIQVLEVINFKSRLKKGVKFENWEKMSGFKRMQSKVFWNQMARHDLDNAPLICKSSLERQIEHEDASYCNFGRDSDTDTDKISENSFTAGGQVDSNCNITACFVTDKAQDDLLEENGHSLMVPEIENAQLARVLSPDQGHGSLDSGFSDSENSKSGNLDTSRRRRKRRKKRDGKVVNKNLFWMKPSHTSTPKSENIETQRNLTYIKDSKDFDEFCDSTDCAKRFVYIYVYINVCIEDKYINETSTRRKI